MKERVSSVQHVANHLFDAGFGDELSGELVWSYHLCVLGSGVGRNGDDGFEEVAGRCLMVGRLVRCQVRDELGDKILGLQPL